jgi:hypothetical protein
MTQIQKNPLDPDVPAGPVGPCIPTADQVPEPPVVIRSIEPSPKFSILIIYYHLQPTSIIYQGTFYIYLRITNIVLGGTTIYSSRFYIYY